MTEIDARGNMIIEAGHPGDKLLSFRKNDVDSVVDLIQEQETHINVLKSHNNDLELKNVQLECTLDQHAIQAPKVDKPLQSLVKVNNKHPSARKWTDRYVKECSQHGREIRLKFYQDSATMATDSQKKKYFLDKAEELKVQLNKKRSK